MSNHQIRVVAMLFGGETPEHEVSIDSAAAAAAALDALPDLAVVPIYISRRGRWHWARPVPGDSTEQLVLSVAASPDDDDSLRLQRFEPAGLDFPQALLHLAVDDYYSHLLILHGANGEDGRLQGALELAGLPFTGSGSAASALAMDKPRCQAYLASRGLPIPGFRTVDRREMSGPEKVLEVMDAIGEPCVVKPALCGSSVGITIVRGGGELGDALGKAFEFGETVIVEKFVDGREFTCAVLDQDEPTALPIIEIVPPADRFFDYDAKYTAGVSREICPAEIDEELSQRLKSLAVQTHRAVGCEGMSRVDFICDSEGPKILEVNTIPGMTRTSLLPQAAEAGGVSFGAMLDRLIEHSRRHSGAGRAEFAAEETS